MLQYVQEANRQLCSAQIYSYLNEQWQKEKEVQQISVQCYAKQRMKYATNVTEQKSDATKKETNKQNNERQVKVGTFKETNYLIEHSNLHGGHLVNRMKSETAFSAVLSDDQCKKNVIAASLLCGSIRAN